MDQLYHVKYIFLKLKLMKSVSQSATTRDRVTNLVTLSIDHRYFKKIHFDKVIDKFADK